MISRMLGAARLSSATYEDVGERRRSDHTGAPDSDYRHHCSFVGSLLSGGDDINVITALIKA